MAVVPIVFSGVFYPKDKKNPPMPGTFVGNAAIAGLEVGGGPIVPPEPGAPPDLIIWGPPDPRPTPPIVIPPPDEFPDKPGPVKPFPPEGGWGYSDRTGWVFKPPAGSAGPKK